MPLTHEQALLATRYASGMPYCLRGNMPCIDTERPPRIGASVTLMLYEHFLCFGQEIDLIWRRPWSKFLALVLVDAYIREIGMLFIAAGADSIFTNVARCVRLT